MDFIKKLLQTNQERGRASIQITVENDYNLPDYEPDMIKLCLLYTSDAADER